MVSEWRFERGGMIRENRILFTVSISILRWQEDGLKKMVPAHLVLISRARTNDFDCAKLSTIQAAQLQTGRETVCLKHIIFCYTY